MYIKRNLSDCRANKWAISAFYTCTTGMKNENKKIRKKFPENDFILRLKFSEKNFLQKSRNDSVAVGASKGEAVYHSTQQANTLTKRTYRACIFSVCATIRAYHIKNDVLPLFVRHVSFYLLALPICHHGKIRA